MSEPVLFEIVIAAPADTVWHALRDRAEVRRWFGWDYDGIDAEIDIIFFGDAAVDDEGHTLDFGPYGRLALEDQGEKTIVRFVRAAPADKDSWDGIYDDVNEGWLKATTIPERFWDYGQTTVLGEKVDAQIRSLLAKSATASAPRGTAGQQVGDAYASFLDTGSIERRAMPRPCVPRGVLGQGLRVRGQDPRSL